MNTYWIGSDLHLDNYRDHRAFIDVPKGATKNDYLILAGDICQHNRLHYYDNYFEYLSNNFKKVFIVEGNHEFYDVDISCQPKYPDNFVLLRNEKIQIDGTIIYGGTMWADLSNVNPFDAFNISSMVYDFRMIKDGDKYFTIDKMQELYNQFIENLYELLLNHKNDNIIVVSHFSPTHRLISDFYKDNALNPYFHNDLDKLIESSNIDYWICGHTHNRNYLKIGSTNVICHPRGYPREIGEDYEFKKIIL